MNEKNIAEKAAVLDQILDLTRNQRDMAEFGINVAEVLLENGIINEAIYSTLLGK